MDYLTFFAILMVVWPFYGMLYIFACNLGARVDAVGGKLTTSVNFLHKAMNYCEKQKRRQKNDLLDNIIYHAADYAHNLGTELIK
jgi:hypothetical protein